MHFTDEQKHQLEAECKFAATRSSGPGGQNVNKVNSRVELRFDLENSAVLDTRQKDILQKKLKNRINSEGEMILVSESERSQLRNRQMVTALFFDLMEKALAPRKKRRKTKPTLASKLKRLNKKRQLSEKKDRRKPPRL